MFRASIQLLNKLLDVISATALSFLARLLFPKKTFLFFIPTSRNSLTHKNAQMHAKTVNPVSQSTDVQIWREIPQPKSDT